MIYGTTVPEEKGYAMKASIPNGIITALVTPFNKNGSVNVQGMRELVEDQIRNGIHGLCALGGTGEPMMMTVDERKLVIDTVIETVQGRVPVVVGSLVGAQSEIIDVARYASKAGAQAVMIMPPYFIIPKPDHIFRHFMNIAENVDPPLILFHTPARSGVLMEGEFICRVICEIKRIVGIKEASGNMGLAAFLLKELGEKVRFYQGSDELILQTLAIGGHGAMISLGNLVPDLFVRMYAAFTHGDLLTARELQLKILPLIRPIYSEPNPGPLKRALTILEKPGGGPTRPPIYPISSATEKTLVETLHDLGLAVGSAR